MIRTLSPLLLLALAAGCATFGDGGRDDRRAGPEFAGRTMRVETAAGQVSRLAFRRDGAVEARFDGRETKGRWSLERRRLCFTWAGNFRECWPYRRPFVRGKPTKITSDRGNAVTVTLQ